MYTTCAVSSGDVWCWGDCRRGLCGRRGKKGDYKPRKVPGVKGAVQVSVAYSYACALHRTGTVSCWGWDVTKSDHKPRRPRRVRGLPRITQISAGPAHVCALGVDGFVRCWGSNYDGQLGQGPVISGRAGLPHRRPGRKSASRPIRVRGVTKATFIASGKSHVCAVHSQGKVSCWGAAERNSRDRDRILRDGGLEPIPLPAKATSVSASDRHSCAVLSDGRLACWNYYTMGEARVGPDVCHGLSGVKGVDDHGWYAVKADGSLVRTNACHNKFDGKVPAFVQSNHTCARTAAGALWCWGTNEHGQLGRPPTSFYNRRP